MEAVGALKAAGDSNPGLQREVNEDRFHVDVTRGLFMVIDGVGGQAAGGKAADTAVGMLRARLERETGPIASRLREAIAIANNQIHRLASLRQEWNGMACVLTAAVVTDGRAVVGHVGDTRLYKLRHGGIQKITLDHSPVGEREDARELSERDAMQHPRRNEVYRDVGSEPHEPGDPDFIDIHELSFEPDSALLLCSDGLTDLVDSSSINSIVLRSAGRPPHVVKALIDAANAAGGKDNVTVVYVEGERFAARAREAPPAETEITRRLGPVDPRASHRLRTVRIANIILLAAVMVLSFATSDTISPPPVLPDAATPAVEAGRIVVLPTQSIQQAVDRAPAGTTIVVEPGEYRETLRLKSYVRLVSSVPRAAVLRLPGAASPDAAAVIARGIAEATIDGFRIVGDSATPLGTGILAVDAALTVAHLEIAGASTVGIEAGQGSQLRIIGTDFRDNPGAAIAVRATASASVSHSVFTRNATAGGTQKTLLLDDGNEAHFASNVFVGTGVNVFRGSSEARAAFARDNWLVEARPSGTTRPRVRGR
jgi:serine/threonine protein phosphatase PrpC